MNTTKQAFTLIELLIVLSIIAIISALMIPAINSMGNGLISEVKTNIEVGQVIFYSPAYDMKQAFEVVDFNENTILLKNDLYNVEISYNDLTRDEMQRINSGKVIYANK